MHITFTNNYDNHYMGIGYMGTLYGYTIESDKYYIDHDTTEWDSVQEAQEHINKCDRCEADLFGFVALQQGKAFNHLGEPHNNVRDRWANAKYVYCKDSEAADSFCQWTSLMCDTYQLDRSTKYQPHTGGYLYENNGGEWVELDEAIGNVIFNLLARD